MTPEEYMTTGPDVCPECGLSYEECVCGYEDEDEDDECNCGDFCCPCGTDVRWGR